MSERSNRQMRNLDLAVEAKSRHPRIALQNRTIPGCCPTKNVFPRLCYKIALSPQLPYKITFSPLLSYRFTLSPLVLQQNFSPLVLHPTRSASHTSSANPLPDPVAGPLVLQKIFSPLLSYKIPFSPLLPYKITSSPLCSTHHAPRTTHHAPRPPEYG
jgi:hypothetical protein